MISFSDACDRVERVNLHRHNATLQELCLHGNNIGDVGATAIGEALRCAHDHCVCLYFVIVVSVDCTGVVVMDGGGQYLLGMLDHSTVLRV